MPVSFTRTFFLVFLLAGWVLSADAQAVETYRVKKSDTMQTIADRFGLSVEELLEYNQAYKTRELRARDILIIPSRKERKKLQQQKAQAAAQVVQPAPVAQQPVEFATHVVAPKETVYGISRQWGITQDQLKEYNPELKTSVLKIGMTLRIPVMGAPETAPAEQVPPVSSPQERSSSVAPQTDRRPEPPLRQPQDEAPEDQLAGIPPVPDDPWRQGNDAFSLHQASQLNVRRALRVDVLLPFYLDRADSLVGETPARRLADSNVALGFYMGVRMALDSLAGQGLVAQVRVFDTRRDTLTIDSLMAAHDFSQTDVLIGPMYAEVAERAARNLRGSKAIVVSPLSLRHDVVSSPNILQVSAPAEDLQQAILRYLQDNLSPDRKVILVASSTGQGTLIARVKSALAQRGITSVEVLDTDLGENAARLSGMIRQGVSPVLIVPSLTGSTVAEVYQAVELSNRLDPVDVYAFEINTAAGKLMREAQGQAASRVRFVYADRMFENTGRAQYNDFVRSFRRHFREFPGRYSLVGFDVTYDVLSRLAVEPDNETALTSYPSEQVADRFRFIKYLGGGYVNTEVFILMHTPDQGTVLLY